jgi:hypothetical protein
MRRDEDFFADKELALIYIAQKLKEALAIEEVLTRAEFDYLVEPDKYRGGVLFVSERIGAFFYVDPGRAEQAREFLAANGYKPWQPA